MRIGIDFDGVIADGTTLKQHLFYEAFGKKIPSSLLTKQRIAQAGLTAEDYRSVVRLLQESRMTEDMQLVPGAKSTLLRLAKHHDVFVVSSRNLQASIQAQRFLRLHRIPFDQFLATSDQSKRSVVEQHALEVFLDDTLSKLKFLEATPARLFLFSQPHNQHESLDRTTVVRVSSWRAFAQALSHFGRE